MQILGIDYGQKKLGFAVGDTKSKLAVPLKVVRYDSVKEVLEKIRQIIRDEQIGLIVVGVSEGQMAEETRKFGEKLSQDLAIEVKYQDETLTTADAQTLSINADIKRKKRRDMEDAYSAALILQGYMGSNY